MMETLPEHVKSYMKTATFTHESVPKGLLKDHSTKPGVWGKLHVCEGEVVYIICKEPEEVISVLTGEFAVIEPGQLHYIQVKPNTSFYVEFFR